MDRNEQTMIRDLFGKLSQAEQTAPPRDPEADRFIRESVESQPGAPYYMAQTIIVQEQALEAAKARIDELERQGSRPFGGLFGNRSRSSSPRPWGNPDDGRSSAAGMGAGAGGYSRPAAGSAARGGGFLAGAAQTAMGVAGGMMLGSMLGGMFAGDEAAAGEMDAGAGDMGAEEMAADETADFGGDFEDI